MKKYPLLIIPVAFIIACGVGSKSKTPSNQDNDRPQQLVNVSPTPSFEHYDFGDETPSSSPSSTTLAPNPNVTTPRPKITTPKPTPKTTTKPASVYYKNCDAVRAAGKAPLYAGQPGYRSALDRDHDGVACETD